MAEIKQRCIEIFKQYSLGPAFGAIVATALLGLVGISLSTHGFGIYGYGLFVFMPFAQGAFAAFFCGFSTRKSLGESLRVAIISVGLTAILLLAFAFEGILCIAMAMPIVAICSAIGSVAGWYIQRRIPPSDNMKIVTLLLIAIFAPLSMSAEAILPFAAPIYEVSTSLIINAPPAVVWNNVIHFPDIPAPTEAIFHTGIAYPIRANIIGSGVGAIRYCEFSTGKFVEPITIWNTNHLLAFDVTHNPEPMHEWSPYGALETPHLHGYMTSRHGQFLLESLPGGKTRLTGTTWYQHHLWPASYWALWSDAIIHSIHNRVLMHIKHVSEQA